MFWVCVSIRRKNTQLLITKLTFYKDSQWLFLWRSKNCIVSLHRVVRKKKIINNSLKICSLWNDSWYLFIVSMKGVHRISKYPPTFFLFSYCFTILPRCYPLVSLNRFQIPCPCRRVWFVVDSTLDSLHVLYFTPPPPFLRCPSTWEYFFLGLWFPGKESPLHPLYLSGTTPSSCLTCRFVFLYSGHSFWFWNIP